MAPGYGPGGQYPGYYPQGSPLPGYSPQPPGTYPPGTYPTGYPSGYPVTGYIPATPTPSPLPLPGPLPGPSSPPTVPVSNPTSPEPPVTGNPGSPATPPDNHKDYWVAWPLPPLNRSTMLNRDPLQLMAGNGMRGNSRVARPMSSLVRQNSETAEIHHSLSGLPGREPSFGERIPGIGATPSEDLKYRGGHTIPHLEFVNLYVGGDDAWAKNDIESIDHSIAAAMSDRNLNNVMMQYFGNQPISSTARPSHPLNGYRPRTMSQGDIEYCLSYLYDKGFLKGYDHSSTVFNFLLPQGTVLTDDISRSGTLASARPQKNQVGQIRLTALADEDGDEDEDGSVIPKAEEGDSLSGLGGFHGSIRKNGSPVYYSVNVYSERSANGKANGIPVFKEPWKNVVATLYHELNEARTDPDVGDAIRNPNDPNSERYLGWVSDRGEECGDYPIEEVQQIGTIVREVALTDGSGTVPVQFQYSNAVHGPEGPIPQPH